MNKENITKKDLDEVKEIVLNMIEENLPNETIMKVTGISPKEISYAKP